MLGVIIVKGVSEIVERTLFEHRKLNDKEILLIVRSILDEYNISNSVNGVKLLHGVETPYLASFGEDDVLYYNLEAIERNIAKLYADDSIFSLEEFYVLRQLTIILHEIRHAIQIMCDYENKPIIKEIINDCISDSFVRDKYGEYYHLFPIEKDASVFANDKLIDIVKGGNYFKYSTIRRMYDDYFKALLKGYDINKLNKGRLLEFYDKIFHDITRYLNYLEKCKKISLHDKLSYNFSLIGDDIKRVSLVPLMINAGLDPRKSLKK